MKYTNTPSTFPSSAYQSKFPFVMLNARQLVYVLKVWGLWEAVAQKPHCTERFVLH
jgi:hypothetical protein